MGFWDTVDGVLEEGGDLVLDGLGLIPGVNVATEAAQGLYHGAHALGDLVTGDTDGALSEGGSALFHGGMAALNFFTGEGGEAIEAGKDLKDVAGMGQDLSHVAHTVNGAKDIGQLLDREAERPPGGGLGQVGGH